MRYRSVPRLFVRVGRAMFTMLESKVAMNVPQATETSTHHLRGIS
jgi:hypothetical protein